MNSLEYLVSSNAGNDPDGSRARRNRGVKPSLEPQGVVITIWLWVVWLFPLLLRYAPTQVQRIKKRERKPSKSSTRAASLPPIPKLFAPRARKLLVLDLDETLVHTMTRGYHRNCQMVELQRTNAAMSSFYYVAKRPFCIDFLRAVMQWYDLAIFTASVSEYADPIIDLLEHDVGERVFRQRLYRDSCESTFNGGYVKDLKVFGLDLGRVILLDNSPASYSRQLGNGLAIEGWISDPSDHALLQLLPLLFALRYTSDVRSVLSLHSSKMLLKA